MGIRILAVDDNQVNLKVVSATLSHAGYEVFTALSGLEALAQVEQVRPDLVILDITMPEMDGYEVCRRLRAKPATSHIPIMMLTAHDTLEEKVKGFEAGADDYLTKPFQPAELQARIKVLLRRVTAVPLESSSFNSKVISVFSLRGGVGVSTLATNIAVGLAQIWGKQVALVDLCLTMGQSALMLNLPLKFTWADISRVNVAEMEMDLVQNIMLNHNSGVSVLAAPRSPAEGELIKEETVQRALELLRSKYDYVIIDMPHDFGATSLAALDASDEILSVLAPDLASVRATVGALEVFDRLNYGREKIKITMNWIFEKRGLPRKDIESVLKTPIQYILPYVPDVFVSSINLGVPPVIGAPNTPIGALFEDLAYAMSREEDQKRKPALPSEAWTRVTERLSARQQIKK
jgi:pilus assembly protein CpaE